MTEPREPQADAAADPGLEVSPELIKDLDVTGDDAGDITEDRSAAVGKVLRPASSGEAGGQVILSTDRPGGRPLLHPVAEALQLGDQEPCRCPLFGRFDYHWHAQGDTRRTCVL